MNMLAICDLIVKDQKVENDAPEARYDLQAGHRPADDGSCLVCGFSKTAHTLHLGFSCLPAFEILLPIFQSWREQAEESEWAQALQHLWGLGFRDR